MEGHRNKTYLCYLKLSFKIFFNNFKAMQDSGEQVKIYNEILEGDKNVMVSALAGSGKTTTILKAVGLLEKRFRSVKILICCFNKKIEEEIKQRRLNIENKNVDIRTINSLGHGLLCRHFRTNKVPMDDNKYSTLVRSLNVMDEDVNSLIKLVGLAQNNIYIPGQSTLDDIGQIVNDYDIDLSIDINGVKSILDNILAKGIETSARIISFTDQIWLPIVLGLTKKPYDYIFVDEAQDLSKAKLDIVLRCSGPDTKLIFVGDPHQAIYAFAGADAKSWKNIREKVNPIELTLSTCYRCPKLVIKLAQEIVPDITCPDTTKDGLISYVNADTAINTCEAKDALVLCRTVAPLISFILKLMRVGKLGYISNRDIAPRLKNIAKDIDKRSFAPGEDHIWELEEFRKKWENAKYTKMSGMIQEKKKESAIEAAKDIFNALLFIVESISKEKTRFNLYDISSKIDTLFENKVSLIQLSTVHSAKGLEKENIFILRPDLMPLRFKTQTGSELDQEMNLKYVALTRSLHRLYFVVDEQI